MFFCLADAIFSTESNRKCEKLYCPLALHTCDPHKGFMSQEITIDHNFQIVLPALCYGIKNTYAQCQQDKFTAFFGRICLKIHSYNRF